MGSPNVYEIDNVARAISALDIDRWSLYQFWPLGERALINEADFDVSESSFLEVAARAQAIAPTTRIEVNAIRERSGAYFFVTPTGRAYVQDDREPERYWELGNVLHDDAVWSAWQRFVDLDLNQQRFARRRKNAP